MTYESVKTEMIGLPEDKIGQVIEFIRFLKYETSPVAKQHIVKAKAPKRSFGSMADKITYIAPDFDTCLEGMEDYT